MGDNKFVSKYDLAVRISTNLNKLTAAMGWSQKELAEEWGIAGSSLTNYLKPTSYDHRIPSLDNLLILCNIPEFKKAGLEFGIDDFLDEAFDPELTVKYKRGATNSLEMYTAHEDFIGNYLCYFNDQTDIADKYGNKKRRELRFGVLTIYDDIDGVTAKRSTKVIARFYEEENRNATVTLKNELDKITSIKIDDESYKKIRNDRNKALIDLMSKEETTLKGTEIYKGEITFKDHFAFIDIESDAYSDKVLIILHIPPKNHRTTYIGGIGSMASVSRGRNHVPSAQKVILSKYELSCSDQDLAPYLNMSYPNFTQEDDGRSLGTFCAKLYNGEIKGLDENDKITVIQNRINKIIKDYIKDNLCCTSCVSETEDAKVYELISSSMR